MSLLDLFGDTFFKRLEEDTIAAVGVSLSRNNKIVTARTVKSVRAVTVFNSDSFCVEAYGGEGLPFIVTDKPANTKMPLDFVGTETGPTGRSRKVFELKPRLKDWKAVIGFEGSDFMLARAIAKNPRKAVDIGTEAAAYLNTTVSAKILKAYRAILASEIQTNFEENQDNK